MTKIKVGDDETDEIPNAIIHIVDSVLSLMPVFKIIDHFASFATPLLPIIIFTNAPTGKTDIH